MRCLQTSRSVMFAFRDTDGQAGTVFFYTHRNPSVHLAGVFRNVMRGTIAIPDPTRPGFCNDQRINLAHPQLMYEMIHNAGHVGYVFSTPEYLKISYVEDARVSIQGHQDVRNIYLYYEQDHSDWEPAELSEVRSSKGPNP